MTVHHDRDWSRPAPQAPGARRIAPTWRWLAESIWWIEHAFERARADARPEEDTRVRIFLILAVFSVVFGCLALGAAYAALLAPKGVSVAGSHTGALVRADLVDREGQRVQVAAAGAR